MKNNWNDLASITDKTRAMAEAMKLVRDVLEGKRAPPGGALCFFPNCRCNTPWQKCEMKKSV